MKITIDTKEDSPEEIKKVLKMLETWLEGHVNAPMSIFGDIGPGSSESSSESSGTDLFSLFDDDKKDDKKEEISGDVIEINSDDKKDDDVPPVTTY